jgi:hypothetical protein
MPCADQFNQITVMTAQTDTHHIFWATGMPAARTQLETAIASLNPVDYTGWQPWRPGQFIIYTVMAPTDWNVFDSSKSLEITPNQQPVWSSFAEPNQPANAPRIFIYHNLNIQLDETPQAVVERHIAQMETDLVMQQADPPTAHPVVPGLVTAVYTTEDTAVFFGAIPYPRGTGQLDPIGATATVPLEQLDSFRSTFERILRSLNGYYEAIPGAPVRPALTSSDPIAPLTATPIPPSLPAPGDDPLATPTPLLHTPTPVPFPTPTAQP